MVAERTALTQTVQIGMESTPGTAVAATKLLQAMDFETRVMGSTDEFRPQGFKFPTILATEREWVEMTMKGQPTYTELIYAFSSILDSLQPGGGSNPTTVAGGAGTTRLWAYEPATNAPSVVQTYTIEQGSSVRAQKMAGCVLTDFNFTFSREKVEMGGKMLGQRLTDGITLSGGVTTVPLVPIQANQITVYMDPTSGGLGTTKVAAASDATSRLLSGSFELTNRFGPIWPVDASLASYANTVEIVPTLSFKMVVEANANGMGMLADWRANTTRFMRIESIGALITGTNTYRLRIDAAVTPRMPQAFSDQQGVYAIEFDVAGIHDGTWGKALHIELQNAQVAL